MRTVKLWVVRLSVVGWLAFLAVVVLRSQGASPPPPPRLSPHDICPKGPEQALCLFDLGCRPGYPWTSASVATRAWCCAAAEAVRAGRPLPPGPPREPGP